MRLLYVAPYIPSRLRPRPYNLIRHLLLRGHHVTAAVLDARPVHGETIQDVIDLGVEVCLVHQPRLSAITRSILSLPSSLPLQVAFCQSPALLKRVRRLLASDHFDVLHVEHIRAASIGLAVHGIPRLFDSVDCMSLLWDRAAATETGLDAVLARLEAPRVRQYEATVLHAFDGTIVSSSVDARALQRIAPGAAPIVVPNAVDVDYFGQTHWQPIQDRLVFSGKMRYHANAHAAVEFCETVLPIIRRHRPAVSLDIVGASPPTSVQRLARLDGVAVTGYVHDIRPYLARASVAICPVVVAAGTQFKILEAMSAGVPVVAYRAAAESLSMQRSYDLLVAETPFEFAMAVIQILQDRDLSQRLHAEGKRRTRSDFTWTAATGILEDVYRELAAATASAF